MSLLKIFIILIVLSLGAGPRMVLSAVLDEVERRSQQIEEIQKQVEIFQRQAEEASGKSKTLAGEISRLDAQVKRVQLEIRGLGLAIEQTEAEITETQGQISAAQQKLELQKNALGHYLRLINQTDQENLTALLFRRGRLTDFFENLKNVKDVQEKANSTVIAMKVLKEELEQKQADLEEKKEELGKLKILQIAERGNLESDRKTKDRLLKETKGIEVRYQELIRRSQEDINRIRDQIVYLEQNGVTVEEAIKFGQLAALRVGVRPAFLLAILEVESRLGRNVGTGNWLSDMYNCYLKLGKKSRAETEKAAFLEIIQKLGLNPDTVKVSREPNYGCGGALGPAQFLPSIWLAYEEEVIRLTGHRPPNPWNIEDAFMASAAKLARAGATEKTKKSEIAAAKTYISGKPTCTKRICNYYANAVMAKAAAIEQSLGSGLTSAYNN